MYIPYYLCGVVRRALIKEKCKPLFYHIDDNFMPVQNFPEDAFILYPNYFGICDKNIDALAEKYPHLIVDNAHSFYSEPKGFACFNSARKFLPVYNGSYLWIRDLKGKYAQENIFCPAPKNEEEIYKNELKFEEAEIEFLHKDTVQIIDNSDTLQTRKLKFSELHKKYSEINLLNIDGSVCSPFCYPCLLKSETEADKLAEKLKLTGIRIYRYWEKLPESFPEYKYFSRLVAIPLGKEL